MPVHGSKRVNHGKEEVFHDKYGWISISEFYDATPFNEDDSENEIENEPEYLSRQSGESFDHYRERIKDVRDYLKPDNDD